MATGCRAYGEGANRSYPTETRSDGGDDDVHLTNEVTRWARRDEAVPPFDLSLSRGGQALVLWATGVRLRLGPARACLQGLIEARHAVVLDVRGVWFIDAAGIGAIVEAHRLAKAAGVTLTLRRPSRTVAKVFALGCVSDIPVEAADDCDHDLCPSPPRMLTILPTAADRHVFDARVRRVVPDYPLVGPRRGPRG